LFALPANVESRKTFMGFAEQQQRRTMAAKTTLQVVGNPVTTALESRTIWSPAATTNQRTLNAQRSTLTLNEPNTDSRT
jgi:hypothetical protein